MRAAGRSFEIGDNWDALGGSSLLVFLLRKNISNQAPIAEAAAKPTAPRCGFSGSDRIPWLKGPQSLKSPPDSLFKLPSEIYSLSKGNINNRPKKRAIATRILAAIAGVLVSPLAYKAV